MYTPKTGISKKEAFKRGIIQFFIIGTYCVILQDKYVSAYFIKLINIFQILFFTFAGALLYAWTAGKIHGIVNKKNAETNKEDALK
jgi:hypothetical protein